MTLTEAVNYRRVAIEQAIVMFDLLARMVARPLASRDDNYALQDQIAEMLSGGAREQADPELERELAAMRERNARVLERHRRPDGSHG